MKRVVVLLAAFVSHAAFAAIATIEVLDGDNQTAVVGQHFAKPLTVKVTRSGEPVSGLEVAIRNSSGAKVALDGADFWARVTTDSNGVAVSPRFASTLGLGSSQLVIAAQDPQGPTLVTGYANLKVTNENGKTSLPLAPLWWAGPDKTGWGFSLPQHGERVFPVLFTYADGQPAWYVLRGDWASGFGSSYRGFFDAYAGTPYYAFDTTKIVRTSYTDDASFDFGNAGLDLSQATLSLVDTSVGAAISRGSSPLIPFRFPPATSRAPRGVSDIWWGGPSQSGWGISIAEDGGNLFVTWFTYGADGKAVWFAMPEGSWADDDTWKGPVYLTAGRSPVELASRFVNVTPYSAAKVGDFTLHFSGTNAATFQYTVEGHSGTLQLQPFDY